MCVLSNDHIVMYVCPQGLTCSLDTQKSNELSEVPFMTISCSHLTVDQTFLLPPFYSPLSLTLTCPSTCVYSFLYFPFAFFLSYSHGISSLCSHLFFGRSWVASKDNALATADKDVNGARRKWKECVWLDMPNQLLSRGREKSAKLMKALKQSSIYSNIYVI